MLLLMSFDMHHPTDAQIQNQYNVYFHVDTKSGLDANPGMEGKPGASTTRHSSKNTLGHDMINRLHVLGNRYADIIVMLMLILVWRTSTNTRPTDTGSILLIRMLMLIMRYMLMRSCGLHAS